MIKVSEKNNILKYTWDKRCHNKKISKLNNKWLGEQICNTENWRELIYRNINNYKWIREK